MEFARRILRLQYAICVTLIVLICASLSLAAHGLMSTEQTWSWNTGAPAIVSNRKVVGAGNVCLYAHEVERSITLSRGEESRRSCVVENTRVSVATDMTQQLTVSFPGDSKYYEIMNMNGCLAHPACTYLASKDMIIRREISDFDVEGWDIATKLNVYTNVTHRLVPNTDWRGQVSWYDLQNRGQPDFELKDVTGKSLPVMSMQTSENENWLVMEIVGAGLVRMDLRDMTMKKFSNLRTNYDNGIYAPNAYALGFRISNDGGTVVVGGSGAGLGVYSIDSACGEIIEAGRTLTDIRDMDGDMCPLADITRYADEVAQGHGVYYPIDISYDSGEVVYRSTLNGEHSEVTVRANGYTPNRQLSYLALGDSYSSGEGDTAKKPSTGEKYYRRFTDNGVNLSQNTPEERCHVSTRSYPYVLAEGMRLSLGNGKAWETVACSGATIYDISAAGSMQYEGQGGRLALYQPAVRKVEALNEFIPGRQKQIEFVKIHKPKVITLTMGGNDVGFGEKIIACVKPITVTQTCIYATEQGKAHLSKQIKDMYDDLKRLYEDLYKASGSHAKVYVLGYPQFVNDDEDASCDLNVGGLNHTERKMITASVTYMNNVIEAASRAAGVKYIDIEDSLVGRRLCDEGEKSVTGVALIGDSQIQESFHPNADGHHRIAMSVWASVNGESLLEYDNCPDTAGLLCPDESVTKENISIPSFFGSASEPHERTIYKPLVWPGQVRGGEMSLDTAPFLFRAGSEVSIAMYSDPVALGVYRTSDKGALQKDILIPGTVKVGYHTLVLEGVSYSGDLIRYEQIVLVKGENPDDVDDDSVRDDQDGCLFVTQSEIDVDGDGVDDACDPYVDKLDFPGGESPGDGNVGGDNDNPVESTPDGGVSVIIGKLVDFVVEIVVSVVRFVSMLFAKIKLWT